MTATELCHLLTYARDHRLGLTTLHALTYIHLHGEAKINCVARHIGITGAALTGTADKLIALGLITRRSGQADRRHVWLEITPRGKAVMDTALFGPVLNSFAEAV